MFIANILALGAFGACAAALPTSEAASSEYRWQVTNMGVEYASGGTLDHLYISGKAHSGMPAFSAECLATNLVDTWQKCKGAKVSHFWTFGEDDSMNVFFKYTVNNETAFAVKEIKRPEIGQEKNFSIKLSKLPPPVIARRGLEAEGEFAPEGGSPGQGPTLKPWKVTGFEWDYGSGGTQNFLDIAGEADHGMPAFDVRCWASNYDTKYRECSGTVHKGAKVGYYWTIDDDGVVDLKFKYTANGKTRNAFRITKMVAPGKKQKFEVYPA